MCSSSGFRVPDRTMGLELRFYSQSVFGFRARQRISRFYFCGFQLSTKVLSFITPGLAWGCCPSFRARGDADRSSLSPTTTVLYMYICALLLLPVRSVSNRRNVVAEKEGEMVCDFVEDGSGDSDAWLYSQKHTCV